MVSVIRFGDPFGRRPRLSNQNIQITYICFAHSRNHTYTALVWYVVIALQEIYVQNDFFLNLLFFFLRAQEIYYTWKKNSII